MVKSMRERVISAICALIIVIPLIILGGYAYYIGVSILSIIGYFEILEVREKEKKINRVVKGLVLISYLCIVMSSFLGKTTFSIDYRFILLDIFMCMLPLITFTKKDYDAEDALMLLAITLFLGISFNYLITIRDMDILYLVYALLVTIMSDTFAHFFGTKIGKYKLAPNISPNKTIEGMIGGVAFGTFIGSMFFLTFINNDINSFFIVAMSLALSLVAEFGDLVFSAIKRRYGVKDYGNIMPGHGGVLDRLDSVGGYNELYNYIINTIYNAWNHYFNT